MTYAEYSNQINNGLALVEAAIERYEVESILNEAIDVKGAVKNASIAIWTAIKRIAGMITTLARSLRIKLNNLIAKGESCILSRDIEVHTAVIKGVPSSITKIIDYVGASRREGLDDSKATGLRDMLTKLDKSKYTIKKGTKINPSWIFKTLTICEAYKNKVDSLEINPTGIPSAILGVLRDSESFLLKVIEEGHLIEKDIASQGEKPAEKEETKKEVANESSNGILAAQCLIEAANLLREEGTGVEQDAIDDIPEEKPEVDDDYDEGVNGADDDNSDPDMEAIKDLLGGDSDALDVLTDDDGSEIIDESAELPDADALNAFVLEW